jgi:hypothetical protein
MDDASLLPDRKNTGWREHDVSPGWRLKKRQVFCREKSE